MEENVAIQLLQMEKEILVDSRVVAEGIGIEHESFMKTIYTYQSELEEFGKLRFEIGASGKTNQPQKYAILNRNQAGVAASLSRNTKRVVRFKVDLFKAIDVMEKQLAETQKQLTDAKAMIAALVQDVHKLPWGLKRHELALSEMTIGNIYQCIDHVDMWLAKPNLTEKQMQKLLDALAAIYKEATSIHATIRQDLETNKRIDDLFFSFYDMVRPALPDLKNTIISNDGIPDNKSE